VAPDEAANQKDRRRDEGRRRPTVFWAALSLSELA
jgi:hypothetical protein